MSLADLYALPAVAATATSQPATTADPSALTADAPLIPPPTIMPAAAAPDRQAAYRIIDRLMSFCGVEDEHALP